MSLRRWTLALPALPVMKTAAVVLALAVAASLAWLATPRLTQVENVPDLDQALPRAFGGWRELPSPLVQVSLSTGDEPNLDQPYDQTVMRAYQNERRQVVYLAVAWGKRQRQEVKIHRPDLCYAAQGFKVASLTSRSFDDIGSAGAAVRGKRMLALARNGGEAVSYWMRIGQLFSEDAFETRWHILTEGLAGRIPDGVLVRASMRVRNAQEADRSWPVIESFLADLAAAAPPDARALMLGRG